MYTLFCHNFNILDTIIMIRKEYKILLHNAIYELYCANTHDIQTIPATRLYRAVCSLKVDASK